MTEIETILKEYILHKWASSGYTYEDVKQLIRNPKLKTVMEKSAELDKQAILPEALGFIYDTMIKAAPLLLFGVPAVVGSLVYKATNPNPLLKSLESKREKDFKAEIEMREHLRKMEAPINREFYLKG